MTEISFSVTSKGRPSGRAYAILCAVFCLVSGGASRGLGAGREIYERFREDAPRRWQEYAAFADRLQGTIDYVQTVDGKPFKRHRLEVRSNGDCRFALAQLWEPDTHGELVAFNRVYAFQLRRRDAAAPWILTGLRRRDGGEGDSIVAQAKEVLDPLCVLITPWVDPLLKLTSRPCFRRLNVQPLKSAEDEELVRVDFENAGGGDASSGTGIQRGSLVLDARHAWCLRQYDLQVHRVNVDSTFSATTEIGNRSVEHPVPKRHVQTSKQVYSDGTRVLWVLTADYDVQEPSPIPADKEFTLTAFGLPEPFGAPPLDSPTRWYLWAGLAAFAALAAGGVFWRMRRWGSDTGAPLQG